MVPRKVALCLPVCLLAAMITVNAQVPPQQQPPPEKPVETPKIMPNAASPNPAGEPVDPNSYVIGAEDVIFVSVFHEVELTGPRLVRPDGKITLPFIGDMQAAGLTPDRLKVQLKQALSTFMNNPDVTITVAAVNSKKFTVTGEVARAGMFPLVVPTRVFDALSTVGFRDFSNKKKIVIIRGSKRIKFNYQDVLHGKHLETNIFLEPGDTIYVP